MYWYLYSIVDVTHKRTHAYAYAMLIFIMHKSGAALAAAPCRHTSTTALTGEPKSGKAMAMVAAAALKRQKYLHT